MPNASKADRVKPLRRGLLAGTAVGLAASALRPTALARTRYDPGASDGEILIGNIMPYSGPASAYGVIGRALAAYFDKVNAEGGVNGRRIRFLSVDDAYNPSRTLEQARRLVEHERVLMIVQVLGTPSNSAIQRYLNQRKVPQLFTAAGATKWGDHAAFPWTMGWQPSYQSEASAYAQFLLESHPRARVAVLYQNDDYGRDYLKGLRDGLGARASSMIAAEASYEFTDSTIDSQLISLRASGADTFFNVATPKFAAQAIRRVAEMGWRVLHLLNSVSSAVGSVLAPAGIEASTGVMSAAYLKDPTDPQWFDTSEYRDWLAWMKRYHPTGDLRDNFNVYAYSVAQTIVQVLAQSGDWLTRENIMRQASNLDISLPMLLPGIVVRTAPDDYFPIERMQLVRFNGRNWAPFGRVYGA